MNKIFIFLSLLILSCSPGPKVSKVAKNAEFDHFYLEKVQPVFDQKCVSCHSCYNAPCQLDLTSFEGVHRGASKMNIYDFPALESNKPTRLGIDARDAKSWQKKGFFSVVERTKVENKSLLDQVLSPVDPKIHKGHDFLPEEDRTCHDDPTRDDFFKYSSRGHMPYGFPDLKDEEIKNIKLWLDFGAPEFAESTEKEVRKSRHADAKHVLEGWERYLNESSLRSRLRSRYIYEHLFLALLTFEALPGEHYRLVRAENDSGEPVEIATVRPFDDAGKFHYRFKKYIRTIMDKTNMPYVLGDARMKRWQELFDERPLLSGTDEFPDYGDKGSNAFKTFKRLEPKSRYEFLLDDAYYHVMTFIKGPVCRGPTALNVINDHFWVMFMDPEKDPTLKDTEFQRILEADMFPPTSTSDQLKSSNKFRSNFWKAIEAKHAVYAKNNLNLDESFIWDGGESANKSALLTVFRHYDSAQVMKGSLGGTPKTGWVLDYHVFEDIYYNLVGGYNVFGPLVHQVNTRLYMEISRISSEDLFLTFMDESARGEVRKGWNQDPPKEKESLGLKIAQKIVGSNDDKMHFKFPYPGAKTASKLKARTASDLFQRIFKARFHQRDFVLKEPLISKHFSQTVFGPGKFVEFFPDATIVKIEGLGSEFFTLIRNRYHYNVGMLFFESDRQNPKKDYFSLIEGVGTSYPNAYLLVKKGEVSSFGKSLTKIKSVKDFEAFQKKFGVSRHQKDFWVINEWFNTRAMKILKSESGRFDLSRYETAF